VRLLQNSILRSFWDTLYYSKSNPCTDQDRTSGFQKFEAPKFHDNRHMKVVRLLAPRTSRLYPPGNIPGIYYC